MRRLHFSLSYVGQFCIIKPPSSFTRCFNYILNKVLWLLISWLSPMSKAPIPIENSTANWQHKNASQIFDYITIADRLRTVSWSNNSHQTGVVKPVNGHHWPIPAFLGAFEFLLQKLIGMPYCSQNKTFIWGPSQINISCEIKTP